MKVRLHGTPAGAEAALAVYQRDGRMPDGVSNGSAVFRRTVAGTDLLAARFGEPGQTSISFSFTGALGQAAFAQDCEHVPAHWEVRVSIGGDGYVSGGCDGGQEDAGHADFSLPEGGTQVRPHPVRMWLAPQRGLRQGGPRQPGQGRAGARRLRAPGLGPGGPRHAGALDRRGRGHTWGLADTVDNGTGSQPARPHLRRPPAGPLVIGYTSSGGHLGLRADGRLRPGRGDRRVVERRTGPDGAGHGAAGR